MFEGYDNKNMYKILLRNEFFKLVFKFNITVSKQSR